MTLFYCAAILVAIDHGCVAALRRHVNLYFKQFAMDVWRGGNKKARLGRAFAGQDAMGSAAATSLLVSPDADRHQLSLLLNRGSQQFGDSDHRNEQGG
ncbi:hypothetical protein JFK97_19570 [Chromobacterium phragmitis]|uniref:hypothetical protein n=2 Tax=Chromobacterium amazonense TaxID=1382803 RepID=UPI0021B7F6B4|nr:hypothetical protein [Chromobacterium amazonense]MBM2886595.1 hypothetical protein [Chromobacterium amazonense]